MKAIEVLVNGNRVCLAGSGPPEATWFALTIAEGDQPRADISVAGTRGNMVVMWNDDEPVRTGDEVTLRVVEVDECDPPIRSTPKWTEFPRVKLE